MIQTTRTKIFYRYARFANFKIYSLRRRVAEYLSNKFHEQRVRELGPDLACLEWLMECGSTQVWSLVSRKITVFYRRRLAIYGQNFCLESASTILFSWPSSIISSFFERLTDSAIADEGFKYFHDLKRLEVLKMNFCDYFGDDAIRELAISRPASTLRDIEIVLNPALTDGAVYWLSRLKALRRAHFYFLPYVSNRQSFLRQLKLAVPRCHVTFPEKSKYCNCRLYTYMEKL
ncbi:unnamed protein product [Haemonchus placei]|uniref:ATP synthase subunit s, mitochondrial n=1 Tax=Haemonchus placei TaxID=6290 RepID=A0A0N4WKG0_HAEPC|nr:unnamed protein product [Haemonchus placei]